MADQENYQVAIDILRCHLGMTAEEACAELGIDPITTQPTEAIEQMPLLSDN
ncbi:hypothetical protein L6J37_03915 [Photobacterium sp. WH77]|uniref:Dethiobiotin synthetase n=1 Tax=Photobacterium arenosum TaxID=2774143 RepID=A0ABR9BI11_9GAMM|nr:MULTISPECIES: hypothetical protein [Photobacterium]MBD8512184.1 hypothetical protein [Photobacterium arenosum]MBV7261626.1 hypothetical protein [Photobacterium sp. WH24]MCG2836006.1 hypothetical protein [Photobacterium sp. WH77]MCG2843859.1 hypothetical protein [Photobacterium sp. WH80]MDO6581256.1 hypothetical protein [Photobacterium sp. 2_MG-2023]